MCRTRSFIKLLIQKNFGLRCKETTLTSRIPADEQFSDFIINKDEKTIWECTEPPAGSVDKRRSRRIRDEEDDTKHLNSREVTQGSSMCVNMAVVLTLEDTSWGPRPCLGSRTGRQPGLSLQTGRRSRFCSWAEKQQILTVRKDDTEIKASISADPIVLHPSGGVGLTSCPAGTQSYVWSCRRWHQPTAQLQYWQRRLCGTWTPQSSSARTSEERKRQKDREIKHQNTQNQHTQFEFFFNLIYLNS